MAGIPDTVNRYRKFIGFLLKYRNSDIFDHAAESMQGGESDRDGEEVDKDTYNEPKELADDLIRMGPTFVKLGQLLSTRPDLLPDRYLEALSELQDDVEFISFEEVRKIVEEETGQRLSRAFESFEKEPLASASIGQVHRAVMKNGRQVAVKIRRPGIKKNIIEELDELKRIADIAVKHLDSARKYSVDKILEEFRFILLNELDYTREADNLITLGKNLSKFENILVPQPVPDYSSSRVLTMDFVEGEKVTELGPLKKMENSYKHLVEELVEAYLKQIVLDGFAHADPHPGNIHLTKDGKLALMDLGMVARFSGEMQENFLKTMIAISRYNGNEVAEVLLEMSTYDEEAKLDEFKRAINRLMMDHQHNKIKEMQTGRLIIEMNRIAADNKIRIAVELNILGKIMLNLDRIVAALDPDFDFQRAMSSHVEKMMMKKAKEELKLENFFAKALEAKRLAADLPKRLNQITENLANNQFEIKIKALDEKRLTSDFQKVANRITLGLVIAAMIIGASLMMQVSTAFTIWGYPGLPMIFFCLAAIAGIFLVINIILKDEDINRKR